MLTVSRVISSRDGKSDCHVPMAVDSTRVNLWPVYDLLGLLTHLHLLPRLLEGHTDNMSRDTLHFVDFALCSVSMDVPVLLALQSSSAADSKVCLLSQCYSKYSLLGYGLCYEALSLHLFHQFKGHISPCTSLDKEKIVSALL